MGLEDRKGMSSERTIDYDALTQEAMRSVVRRVLEDTVEHGLPGDHHFYISFDTLASGVVLSKRLRDKYAEEMTIVLQHRFWDLAVANDYFEVKLTFDGIPERLVIPFRAIKVFFDPSVRYGLQFETVDLTRGDTSPSVIVERGDLEPKLPTEPGVFRADHAPPADVIEPAALAPVERLDDGDDAARSGSLVAAPDAEPPASANETGALDGDGEAEPDDAGSKVVSLDAFRKK